MKKHKKISSWLIPFGISILLVVSCGKSGSSSSSGTSTNTTVTSGTSTTTSGNSQGTQTASPPAPGIDLSDPTTGLSFPTVTNTLGYVSTFQAYQAANPSIYTTPSRTPLTRKIAFPDGGGWRPMPACAYPVPAPKPLNGTNISIDGDLSDWPTSGNGIVATFFQNPGIDPSGATSTLPLLNVVRANIDSTGFDFAFTFSKGWTDASKINFNIAFNRVLVPSPSDANPAPISIKSTVEVIVSNGVVSFEDVNSSSFVDAPAGTWVVASNPANGTMEVRINQSLSSTFFDPSDTTPLNVVVAQYDPDYGNYFDSRFGFYLSGFTVDYGCLVPMTNNRFKLFVFQRLSTVTQSDAENYYRYAAAGAPLAEQNMKDTFDLMESIPWTVVQSLIPGEGGLNFSELGIFLLTGAWSDPTDIFSATAHEYAHYLNSFKRQFPSVWMREGHSQTAGRKSVKSFYGDLSSRLWGDRNLSEFVQKESDFSQAATHGITDTDWFTTSNVEPASFYYGKTTEFVSLVESQLPGQDITPIYNTLEGTGAETQFLVDVESSLADSSLVTATQTGTSLSTEQDYFSGWLVPGGYDPADLLPGQLLVDDTVARSALLQADLKSKPLLTADNSLDDWRASYPQSLSTDVSATTDADSTCAGTASLRIKEYGAAFDGDVFIFAFAMEGNPAKDSNLFLAAYITEPSGVETQIDFSWSNIASGWYAYSYLFQRPSSMGTFASIYRQIQLIGVPQSNEIELFVHRSWMNLPAWVAGTQVSVQSGYLNASGTVVSCTVSPDFVPTFL